MNPSPALRFCPMMFLQFFIWGVWYVPMWTFLGTLEIEATLRGTAYAATGVAAMISPFIVGMIADRYFCHSKGLWFPPSSRRSGFAFGGAGSGLDLVLSLPALSPDLLYAHLGPLEFPLLSEHGGSAKAISSDSNLGNDWLDRIRHSGWKQFFRSGLLSTDLAGFPRWRESPGGMELHCGHLPDF